MQWDRVNDALGYKVTFTPEDGSCDGVEGGNVLVMGGANVSHTLQKLEEFTEYRVDVRSQAIVGVGVSSDPISKRTRVAGMLIGSCRCESACHGDTPLYS